MSSSAAPTKKNTAPKAAKAAAAPAAAATVAAPVAAPAPVVAAPVVAAPVAAPAAAVNTVSTTESEDVNIVAQFNSLVEQVNTARTALTTIFSAMKKLEKQIPRELKKAGKGRRRSNKAPETTASGEPIAKKPSVFTIPTQISDALATFLGLAKGTQISRSEVTTRVCKYAKDHNLMDKQNIKPDAALRKLLGVKEADQLRILNLQKYLSDHYPLSVKAKADKAAAAAAAAAPRA
jgi:chromatin remodeling complex protein RSC6